MARGDMMRLVLQPKDASADEGMSRQLVLDLAVDPDTQMSTGPFPAFGRAGDFRRPETLFPFTLMMDGRLDFGAHASDAQRLDVLAIRAAKLMAGSPIARSGADGDDMYVIASITPLASD
jgi:hypothetical protein